MRITDTHGFIQQLIEFVRPHNEQERRDLATYSFIVTIIAAAILLYLLSN